MLLPFPCVNIYALYTNVTQNTSTVSKHTAAAGKRCVHFIATNDTHHLASPPSRPKCDLTTIDLMMDGEVGGCQRILSKISSTTYSGRRER